MSLTLAQSKAAYPRAVTVLKRFYESPGQPGLKLPISSLDALITHYRTHRYSDGTTLTHDDFMKELDGAAKFADSDDTGKAVRTLRWGLVRDNSKVGGVVKLPKNEEFFKVLAKQVSKVEGKDLLDALIEALKKYIKTLAIIALLALAAYLLLNNTTKAFAKKAIA